MWNTKSTKGKYVYENVEEFPFIFKPNTVYIEGTKKQKWTAALICPCGCNEIIFLNLLNNVSPYWKITTHWFNNVSISPSINRKFGCRSHFILRNGCIYWSSYY